MITEIFIKPSASGVYERLDLEDGLPLPFTYALSDIRDPGKKQGNGSQTLIIPGTANNNKIFNYIFEVGIDCTFNVNKKADCYVLQDTIPVIPFGIFMLTEVENVKGKINYHCAIYSGVEDLLTVIKDLKLTDLSLADLDHDYTEANIGNSWSSATRGAGYVYPMIDYWGKYHPGGIGAGTIDRWAIEEFLPAVYVKEYVDRIFSAVGRSYTSNFLTGSFFKSLIIPYNKDRWKFSDAYHVAREFRAERSSNQIITFPGGGVSNQKIIFDNDSTGTAYDPSNVYNTSNGQWVCPSGKSGTYTIQFSVTIQNNNAFSLPYLLSLSKNSGFIFSSALILLAAGVSYTFEFTESSLNVQAGDIFEIWLQTSSTPSVTTLVLTGSYFQNSFEDNLSAGTTLEMNSAIPEEVLQSEFILGLCRMFNLYLDQSRDNPNDYIIEPRDDYYQATVIDWSQKLDQDKGLTTIPMSELKARRFKFRYKEDKDFLNDDYQKRYTLDGKARTFGDLNLDVNNDWLSGEESIEPVFSASPMIGDTANSRIIPQIVKAENQYSTPERTACNIRILYWAGQVSYTGQTWQFNNTGGSYDTFNTYPYAGHLDNPHSPDKDLSFGTPEEIAWDYLKLQRIGYPDSNLFNVYWGNTFNEITDKDARLVSGYFLLTPLDLLNLSFRELYFFEGQLWRLNQVIDYDFDSPQTTKCEFIKALAYGAWVTTKTSDSGKPPFPPKPRGDINGNVYFGATAVQGKNNYVPGDAIGAIIIGDNNSVGQSCSGVVVYGNSNIINGGVSNVTLINTSGKTITDSNQLWVNGCQVSACIVTQTGDTGWGVTGYSTLRTLDVGTSNLTNVLNFLGTLTQKLIDSGIISS